MLRRLLLTISCAVVVAGCGGGRGDGGPSAVDRAGSDASRAQRVVATLGDSIVAGSPRWDPDPDVRASFASPTDESQWQHWVDDDAIELRNCGVWGERTDEIATRLDGCTDGAAAVVIQGGINDIAQGRPVRDALAALACIADDARARKLDIALVEVLPWNNGFPDAVDEIDEINVGIRALAKRGGVPVLPFASVLEDPDAPDRMPEQLTTDGDHPNVAGYRRLGEQAWRTPKPATGSFGCVA